MLPLYRTLKYKVAYIGGVCMSRGKMKLSSEERLALADGVVRKIDNLSQDEMYVLSIHFETAKQNEL